MMAIRRTFLVLLASAVAVLPFADGALAAVEKRVALVIGIARYANVPPLRSPVNDASAIAMELQSSGFSTTVVTDPDQKAFRRALASFEQTAEGADVALVYYAGHAVQAEQQNYVFPTDANPQSEADVPSDGISLARVRRALDQAKLRIVIVDACRDNPFASRFPTQRRGMDHGLAAEPPEASTVIAFSASPGQSADDGDNEHSPYAAALLKHVLTPGLELSVLLLRVSGDVRRATKNQQTPMIQDDRDREFYFVPAGSAAPAIPDQPPTVALEQPSANADNSEVTGERNLIVRDVAVVGRPGIGAAAIGRLRVGDIVVVLPYKSERWRAIQMSDGQQGFVEITATRLLQ